MGSQEAFLARVRRALQSETGHTSTTAPEPIIIPESEEALHARLREQRPQLVVRLQEELRAVGGNVVHVQSVAEATQYVTQLAQDLDASLIVRWQSDVLDALEIDASLEQEGIDVHLAEAPQADEPGSELEARRQEVRERLARADIGLSGVDYAIAETGTLALSALPGQMRGVSLLPPVHVAVASSEQIVATLADCLALFQAAGPSVQERLSSCVSFITGPSRTGDIELSLTVGVHGPGELHLVILDGPEVAGREEGS
ncbi:MAG: lactate utilization protein [Candidatus Tectomicrobia bacterium]|nr:lactate utilization protein [Candidatus Tectomicrobia bacterium]